MPVMSKYSSTEPLWADDREPYGRRVSRLGGCLRSTARRCWG